MANVFVKGIGKVFFPDSMGQKEIADTLAARSQELLDMTTSARMQRAKEQGFDVDDPTFSGSMDNPKDRPNEILPLGVGVTKDKVSVNNLFGGIFGSKNKRTAESFGDDVMEIVSDKPHIDADDFTQVADMDEFKRVIEDHRGETLTAEEADELFDYIVSEKRSPFDDVPDMSAERLEEIMGATDAGEMSWAFQGLKGELARRQGFGSVGMLDETGESVLMLTGRNLAKAAFDPARKGSRDLLAGAGAGLATAAGTLAGGEDAEAGVVSKAGKTFYHGTAGDFESFKPNSMFASDPKYANIFASMRNKESGGGGNVIPVKLNEGKQWEMIEYGEDVPYIHQVDQSNEALIAKGYDSTRRADGAVTIFDPKNVRSVNAQFDPSKSSSRDMLAGIGALGAGALFTPDTNKALADQGLSHLIPTGDTIEPDEFPRLERAADFIDEYTQTPFGPAFEGISQYLRGFGEDSEGKDKAKRAMMAALDLI